MEKGKRPEERSPQSLQQLLASLQGLMQRVRWQLWEQRLQHIFSSQSNRDSSQHILELLSHYIDAHATECRDDDSAIDRNANSRDEPRDTTPPRRERASPTPSLKQENHFSRHLIMEDRRTSLPPSITIRLQHSIWEHIHATIRHTKSGDRGSAELHATLTQNALHEVAHYMNERELQAFHDEIKEALQKMLETL